MAGIKLSVFLFLGIFFYGNAQDCILNIGGKDTETIIKIFQLNEEQITKMHNWQGEVQVKTRLLEEQMQHVLDTHPQSNPDDILRMSQKYKDLQDKLMETSMTYDQKLLAIFNERQYQRYIDLCQKAYRRPMAKNVVTPE